MRLARSTRATAVLAAMLLLAGHPLDAQRPRAPATPPGSPAGPAPADQRPVALRTSLRSANYSIDVELDPGTRTLVGRQVLTWRNITARPASELRFHLYYNAWLNDQSSWMRESALAAPGTAPSSRPAGDWGWIDVTGIRLLAAEPAPFTDLTAARKYIAPDDGNREDRTLMAVPLPRPVAPGESIVVELAWTSKVPRTFARTGVIGHFYFLAHWFPKIGVLEDAGWSARQFHFGTEFYADYGVYDVRITVPRGWIVGATGREQQRLDTPGGKTMHRYVQEDVHDFAWTTSPALLERRELFEHSGLPPVEMRLLLQPEHAGQAARHFAATRAALQYYGQWFGPYPYGHVTIVDPAWQSGAGGMEYPTLFTAGTRWLAPRSVAQPEGVTIHEAGHQFWYGLVGNNEFEHAWIDEGLNTFATARVLETIEHPRHLSMRVLGGFVPWVFRDITLGRATDGNGLVGYRFAAATDVPATPSWQYHPATGAAITYSKTALWLHTLERLIGWPRLQRGMALFFGRHVFGHPTPKDFFAALNAAAGEDLTWFFDQTYRSAGVVDYGIQQFSSEPARVRGWTEREGARVFSRAEGAAHRHVTELVVRRHGEAVLPVDVLVTFADGERVREHWDGRERWRLYRWERPARAVSAEVDPDRVLLLDVNYTNNTWTLTPAGRRAATKWAAIWLGWLQDALLTWAALV